MDLSETLSLVRSVQSNSEPENNQSIVVDAPIQNVDNGTLERLLSAADTQQSYLSNFRIVAKYEDDRPVSSLISVRSNSLLASDIDPQPEDWLDEFIREAAFYIEEDRYSDLADTVYDVSEDNVELRLRFRVLKQELESAIVEKSLNHSQIEDSNPSLWTNTENLLEWVRNADIEEIIDEFFDESKLPLILVLSKQQASAENGLIRLLEVSRSGKIAVPDFSSSLDRYQSEYSKSETMFKTVGVGNPVPATIFSTKQLREIFRKPFLFSFVCSISETVTLSGDILSYEISSDKQELSGELDLTLTTEYDLNADAAFEFISKFYERGEQRVYRDIWHKAIIEHCENIQEIPKQNEDILYYYESLEQNAIEGNFTELSSAVQDAQIFIGDVTNTISTSTINLTTEIQKVVIALFSIVGLNAFLIARNGSYRTAIPFTTILLTGLLIFYFPTAQSRVSEISNIIDEGEKDASVYSDLAENVGAEAFVDIEKFESRQNAYIDIANKRVNWAERRLKHGFLIISLTWLLIGAYGLMRFPVDDLANIVVFSTVLGALWMWKKHTDQNYTGDNGIYLQLFIIGAFVLIEVVRIALYAGWITISDLPALP